MAEYTGTFESGVSGNTVQTSDPGSNNAWDDRGFDADGTLEYSNIEKYQTLSCRMVLSATPSAPFVAWTSSTLGESLTELWGRIYMWHSATPTLHQFFSGFDTGVPKIRLRFLASGVLRITTASTDTDGVVPITTGDWIRVEFHGVCSPTDGFVEAKLFNDADSLVETETIQSPINADTGTKINLTRWGETSAGNPSRTVYMDNILINDTGYPGPFGVVAQPEVLAMQHHVFGHNVW